MKYWVVPFTLFCSAIGGVNADPNIYGPGGINLGPDGELPVSRSKLQKDSVQDEYREQIRVLQEQVRQLQYEVRLLQQIQQLQAGSQGNPQNQYQVEINYGYPAQDTGGRIWSGPFVSSGGAIVLDRRHYGGGHHHQKGSGRGRR